MPHRQAMSLGSLIILVIQIWGNGWYEIHLNVRCCSQIIAKQYNKVFVDGAASVARICFFALRPIQVSEELTFDYQLKTKLKKTEKCLCGAKNCRGNLY